MSLVPKHLRSVPTDTSPPVSSADHSHFWQQLCLALTRRDVPFSLRTPAVADVGWGGGLRVLIDDTGRVTHPRGVFVALENVDVEEFAEAIRAAYRLTPRERHVLGLLRDGAASYRHHQSKMATVGNATVRGGTLERLCWLGLVREVGHGSHSEYAAVPPDPLQPPPAGA